ncbi:hypothetical protein L1987_13379 [Smallanthus sonchifolius]|uniref:Uncharacterized protein n=1 Tax=Smallanthus sonchifolius TaxID=185202 RepID=A0ACB9JHW8_9ASTR|nr:hypothetical protein L1987_13379 [Smallanthus sonchifolius]
MTLVETARTMLVDSKLPVTFWAEVVNTACHVLNRVLTVERYNKTCYELLNNRKPNLDYLLPFGNPCTLFKVRDVPTKFSAKAIGEIFLGIVVFLPTVVSHLSVPSTSAPDPNAASCLGTQESDSEDENGEIPTNLDSEIPVTQDLSYQSDTTQVDVLPVPEVASIKELKAHPISNIIGDLRDGVQTRYTLDNTCLYTSFKETGVFDEELAQFDKLKVWNLVDLPKWVFKCKKDDRGVLVRNKARLVIQDFNQQEGIDYTEVYAPVARLEAISLFLAFASYKGFKVFQLDVKSVFLCGKVKEEVYLCQPPGFEDPINPSKVFKLDKALYGLHKAPRACRGEYLLVQIYVDDIIFGSTNEGLCKEFEGIMKSKFEMSAMGELSFFLGLQVNQKEDGFFIHQSKYVKDILSRFKMEDCTPYDTPIPVNHKLNSDPDGKKVDCRLYHAMIGSLMYLTASRPDIMFAVCICSRFQAKPKESHLIEVKRIFRYLKGKQRLGLWFPHGLSLNSMLTLILILVVVVWIGNLLQVVASSWMARRVEYKHNQVALLDPNMSEAVNFHRIINFLNRSRLHVALSANPYTSLPYIQQFWDTVHQDTDVEPHVLRATVNNTEVAISVETIRAALALGGVVDDPMSYPGTLIMGCFQRMGYRGRPNDTQARKGGLVGECRYLMHVIIQCLSPRKAGTDGLKIALQAAMVALTLNKRFNFALYIYRELVMQINPLEGQGFLMYPSTRTSPESNSNSTTSSSSTTSSFTTTTTTSSAQQQQVPAQQQQQQVPIPQEQIQIPVNEPVQDETAQDNDQDLDTSSGDTILPDSEATDTDSSRDFSSDHYARMATLPLANVGKRIKSTARKPRRKSVRNPPSGSVLGKRTLIDESSDLDSDAIPVPKAQKLMSASIAASHSSQGVEDANFVASLVITHLASIHTSPVLSPHVSHTSKAGPSKPSDSERITFLESQVLALQTQVDTLVSTDSQR